MARATSSFRHRYNLECRGVDQLCRGGVVRHCIKAQVHDLETSLVGPSENNLVYVGTLAIGNRSGVVVNDLAGWLQDTTHRVHTNHPNSS
jgi:hypothetical protein